MESFNLKDMKKLIISLTIIASASIIRAQTDVIFYTNYGTFTAEIYDSIVPITGGNFLGLVDQKFYDGIIFHRVIDNFMIQGGDPTGTGTGGSGVTIPDEFHPSLKNVTKMLSMANKGPNTGTSQFFINLVDNAHLDGVHAVFGKVILDFTVVQTIGAVATDGSDRPLSPVVMDSVRVDPLQWVGIQKARRSDLMLSVFPNPINSSSVLAVTSKNKTNAVMQIHDVLGKQISTQQVELKSGGNSIRLASSLGQINTKGIYHLSLIADNNVQRISIIIP